jgi:hypothetical protein
VRVRAVRISDEKPRWADDDMSPDDDVDEYNVPDLADR